MKITKEKVIVFALGMVFGYMAERQLDKVPVMKWTAFIFRPSVDS